MGVGVAGMRALYGSSGGGRECIILGWRWREGMHSMGVVVAGGSALYGGGGGGGGEVILLEKSRNLWQNKEHKEYNINITK